MIRAIHSIAIQKAAMYSPTWVSAIVRRPIQFMRVCMGSCSPVAECWSAVFLIIVGGSVIRYDTRLAAFVVAVIAMSVGVIHLLLLGQDSLSGRLYMTAASAALWACLSFMSWETFQASLPPAILASVLCHLSLYARYLTAGGSGWPTT